MCSKTISFLAAGAQRRRNTLFSLRRISRHIRQPTHFSHPELLAKDERKNNCFYNNNFFADSPSWDIKDRVWGQEKKTNGVNKAQASPFHIFYP